MTTLLVGTTGLLGPDICQRLTGAGRQVRALLRLAPRSGVSCSCAPRSPRFLRGRWSAIGGVSPRSPMLNGHARRRM